MIEKAVEALRVVWHTPRSQRAWFFSHVVVPGLLVGYLASGFSPISPFAVFEDGLSVVDLKSQGAGADIAGNEGTLLLLEPLAQDFAFSWADSAGSTPDVQSSLLPSELRDNAGRLSVDSAGIRAELPLLGVGGTTVLVTNRKVGPFVRLPGRSVATASLGLYPGQSIEMALWALICGIFGIGLAVGSGPSSGAQPEKGRRRQRAG